MKASNLVSRRAFAASALAAAATAQSPRRILLLTDGEGVAGICRQEEVEPTNAELRALLVSEVNAAVEGFLAGGATEVVVWDGHNGSKTLTVRTLHPKAKLMITAGPGGSVWNGTLDRGYAALAFLGQHAMGNVPRGVMAHSFSSLGIQEMKLNGKPVGEIGIWTAIAGAYNTPVIFLSGDDAAVEELRALVPDAEFVSVKEGLARYACISLSAEAAREAIRDGAKRAMARIGKVRPQRVAGPATLEIEYTTRNSLNPDLKGTPGVEVLSDLRVRYSAPTVLEVWKRYRVR